MLRQVFLPTYSIPKTCCFSSHAAPHAANHADTLLPAAQTLLACRFHALDKKACAAHLFINKHFLKTEAVALFSTRVRLADMLSMESYVFFAWENR